jgi:SNF2 family DNA or RNA helicase
MEILLYCPMTAGQRELYESVKRGELAKLIKDTKGSETDHRTFMNILMQLRKASNHPFLHFDPTADMKQTDKSIIEASGKMVVLDALLQDLKKKGHKVLIFSQFTSMLDIIDDYLRFLRPQYKYCRLDGTTHFTERRDLMKDFNSEKEDYFIFLLSTRAGGVGINLAGLLCANFSCAMLFFVLTNATKTINSE